MQGYNGFINTVQAVEVMKSKLTLWDASAVLLAVPVALPVLAILLSFFVGSGDTFGHLATTVLPDYLLNTVLLMLLVGVIALMVGVPTAWLTARYRFPGSRVFPLLLVLPLAAPAYVLGYVYADLLDYTGLVQTSLPSVLGLVVLAAPFGHCLAQRWSLPSRYIPTFFYWRGSASRSKLPITFW